MITRRTGVISGNSRPGFLDEGARSAGYYKYGQASIFANEGSTSPRRLTCATAWLRLLRIGIGLKWPLTMNYRGEHLGAKLPRENRIVSCSDSQASRMS